MRRTLSLLLSVLALVSVSCGSDGESADDSESSATTVVTTAAPEITTPPTETSSAPEPSPEPAEEAVFPGATWTRPNAEEAGVDPAGAAALAAFAADTSSGCVAVVHGGELVLETYDPEWDSSTDLENFSATKSVSAVLVGIAQDLGFLDIDEAASTYLTEWVGTDSETITIRNLLSNDSGRFWEFDTDYIEMVLSPDRSAFAIGLEQQFEPGTHWEYNNSAIQTLEEVLQRATGSEVADFAEEHLFGPLGMDVRYALDASGNTPTFMGLQAGCVDMARFGWMARHSGTWGPTQIVSSEYMGEATRASQELNPDYGFLWWNNQESSWDGIPEDAFAALGLGDQVTLVVPSLDMVVVRVGDRRGTADYQGNFLSDLGVLAIDALAAS
jgi:CubicO group peptidase (beta-lactamase class C family)